MTALLAYFERSDTPTADSPTGRTMVKILAKHPELTFDEARTEAGILLSDASRRRHYAAPPVLSVDEKAAALAATRARFAQWKPPAVAA